MSGPLTVLAIGAHPDDLELLCGGTLALYARQGASVFMYHATDGSKGGLTKSSEEIRQERIREAEAAAAVIGATSFGGDFPDGEVETSLANRLIFIDAIRRCRPDVVFTHHPNDYHTDHVNVSRMVFESIYQVAIPRLETRYPALDGTPRLFSIDTVVGIGFEPQEYVDISGVIELKKQMMKAHDSQLAFVRDHHGVDFVDMIEICARYRGYQCNARYAEAFAETVGWPRGSASRVLP